MQKLVAAALLTAALVPTAARAGKWVPVNPIYAASAAARGKLIVTKDNPVGRSLGIAPSVNYEYKPNAFERLLGTDKALRGPR